MDQPSDISLLEALRKYNSVGVKVLSATTKRAQKGGARGGFSGFATLR